MFKSVRLLLNTISSSSWFGMIIACCSLLKYNQEKRMAKKSIIILLIFSCSALSGCASFNSVADHIGVNFWSHKTKKSPCKVASVSDIDLPCVGTKIMKPDEEYILKLRGSYGLV